MRVLNLVTNDQARFFRQQVSVLDSHGIDNEILTVPGKRRYDNGNTSSRPASAYVRFMPTVLRHSFGDFDLIHANYGLTARTRCSSPTCRSSSRCGVGPDGEYGWLSKLCGQYADAVVVMSRRWPRSSTETAGSSRTASTSTGSSPSRRRRPARRSGGAMTPPTCCSPTTPSGGEELPTGRTRRRSGPRTHRRGRGTADRLGGLPRGDADLHERRGHAAVDLAKRGSPNAVKEALACNLPVVSTPVGDVAERIEGVTQSRVAATDEDSPTRSSRPLETEGRSNGAKQLARSASRAPVRSSSRSTRKSPARTESVRSRYSRCGRRTGSLFRPPDSTRTLATAQRSRHVPRVSP